MNHEVNTFKLRGLQTFPTPTISTMWLEGLVWMLDGFYTKHLAIIIAFWGLLITSEKVIKANYYSICSSIEEITMDN